ncbi:DUF6266 family protein [Elizabethkingia meningoseptica]|uniref:DUF6266 family protein n=1 Tax=Elizabethkingia meningoseptica TaxID=238 RepID=UPI0038922557
MARIEKGILGGFKGKVGTVVGVTWRGMDIIRSVPRASRKKPTEDQLLQRFKFKLVVAFLQPLKEIQSLYFGSNQGTQSRVNIATSYVLSEAVEMVNDIPAIVYSRVMITKGDLAGFQSLKITPKADAKLSLEWEGNGTQSNAQDTDMVNLICYNEKQSSFAIFEGLTSRNIMKAEAILPADYKEVHVWAYLSNEKKTQASTSVYFGKLTFP